MEIKFLEAEQETKVFGLIAGRSGVGKTSLAAQFPKKETVIISLEKGLLSIKGSGFAAVEITSYDQLIDTIKEINHTDWINYVVIDSLSEIYDLLKKECKDKFTASQNYAKNDHLKQQLFHSIRCAKFLTKTVYFICHTKDEKDGIETVENLAFDGKMPEDLKKQFDLIVHMTYREDEEGKKHRVFVTNPDISRLAKARVSPFMGTKINDIEKPNLYELTKKLLGKGE